MSHLPDIDRAERIFYGAMNLTGAQLDGYLDRECGQDAVLRSEVESLLNADGSTDGFLDRPEQLSGKAVSISNSPHFSDRYKLLQEIGEGGFGVVYMAEQLAPVRRKVAIKVVKPGMDSRAVVARFEAERQALAMMDHPNIARVLDGGTTADGKPYFVMDLVRGVPITDYCNSRNLTTQARLKLFSTVCDALQHAHQKGIIHRDIKPSNVMITLVNDEPVAKVIDFGVAKALNQELTEKTLFTNYGAMVGTPQYMSPEQASMSGLDVDTRSDVYSLGVLLYELLTGRPPIEKAHVHEVGLDAVRRLICESEPPRPSAMISTLAGDTVADISRQRSTSPNSLSKVLKGDLDWVIMKCIEKDRNRRYASASAIAADIDRHLHDEPVYAGPPTLRYQLLKLCRRHQFAAYLTAVSFLALLCCVVVSSFAWAGEKKAKDDAIEARVESDRQEQIARRNADAARKEAEKARKEATRAQQALAIVTRLLSSASPTVDRGPNTTVRDLLGSFAAGLEAEPIDDPEVELEVRLALAAAFSRFDAIEDAKRHLNAARKLCIATSGKNSLAYVLLLARIADYLDQIGHEGEDIKLLREAIAIAEDIRVPSPVKVDLMTSLGTQVEHNEGIGLLRKAISLVEGMMPTEKKHITQNPYRILLSRLRFELDPEGLDLTESAVDFAKEALDASEVSLAYSGRSEAFLSLGRVSAACEAANLALEVAEESDSKDCLGAAIRQVLASSLDRSEEQRLYAVRRAKKSLDANWRDCFRFEPAPGELIADVAGHLLMLGEKDDAKTVLSLANSLTKWHQGEAHETFAWWVRRSGFVEDAIQSFRISIELFEQCEGSSGRDWRNAFNYCGLARCYMDVRNFDLAIKECRLAIETSNKQPWQITWLRFELAELLYHHGEIEEALDLFRQVRDALTSDSGWYGPATAAAFAIAALRCEACGDKSTVSVATRLGNLKASARNTIDKKYYHIALALQAEANNEFNVAINEYAAAERLRTGADEPIFILQWVPDRLTELAKQGNQLAEVVPLLQDSVKRRDEQLQEHHPERAYARIRLATVLNETGDFARAARLLRDAKAIYEFHGDVIPKGEHERLIGLAETVEKNLGKSGN